VPPGGSEAGVSSVEVLADRQAIEERESADRLGIVEREPEGVVAAAVVPHKVEPVVPQTAHRRPQMTRAGPL